MHIFRFVFVFVCCCFSPPPPPPPPRRHSRDCCTHSAILSFPVFRGEESKASGNFRLDSFQMVYFLNRYILTLLRYILIGRLRPRRQKMVWSLFLLWNFVQYCGIIFLPSFWRFPLCYLLLVPPPHSNVSVCLSLWKIEVEYVEHSFHLIFSRLDYTAATVAN